VTIRPIVICGEPVLHRPTIPVDTFDDELRSFVDDLFETNEAARGAGLAANQVGDSRRVFIYDCPDEAGVRHRGYVVNPVIETSVVPQNMPDPDDDLEGCLSVPGEHFPTGRASWARVTGVDVTGEPTEVVGTGYFARCLQHETDHLDGHLYLDRRHRAQRPRRPQGGQGARLGGAGSDLDAWHRPRTRSGTDARGFPIITSGYCW
jgi:peptide deformylase